jgi:phage tail-like protein
MAESQDPFRAQSFYLDLGGIYEGPILKVTGLAYEREPTTVQQAVRGAKTQMNTVVGKYKPATLTIQKAVTNNTKIWDWRKKVLTERDITKVRTNASLIVEGEGGKTMRWEIINVWPSRIKGPTLDANGNKAIEEIELCYEEIKHAQ